MLNGSTTLVPFKADLCAIHQNPLLRHSCSVKGECMTRYRTYDFDNRDSTEVYTYLEARIEALRGRIMELENENDRLYNENARLYMEISKDDCLEHRQFAASA